MHLPGAATVLPHGHVPRRSVISRCVDRRTVLGGLSVIGIISPAAQLAAAQAAPAVQPPTSWLAGPPEKAVVTNPGNSWALTDRDRQLYYPAWLEGTWDVTARFIDAGFPLGQKIISREVPGVLKGSMLVSLADVGAAMEHPVTWQVRYHRADATPELVTADRVFNVQQEADALLLYPAVRSAEYDPGNPTRLAVVYATPRKGAPPLTPLGSGATTASTPDSSIGSTPGSASGGAQRPAAVESVDLRKAELFVNNRGSTGLPAEGAEQTPQPFTGWELYRQVTQGSRQGLVGDYMQVQRFTPQDVGPSPGAVAVQMRVFAFLQPQDRLYFETGSKAVAVYDYQLQLQRVSPL